MKTSAKQARVSMLWQPPLSAVQYRRRRKLSGPERTAIVSYLNRRSDPHKRGGLHDLSKSHPLAQLLQPIRDALDLMGSKKAVRVATMAVLLRECLQAGATFWDWSSNHWLDVMGRHSRAFRNRNKRKMSQSVRIEIAGVACLHGWFRDVLALGHFKRDSLAKRVLGAIAVDAAAARVLKPLEQWGYRVGTPHFSCLCKLLLRNERPNIEHLTDDVLDRFRQDQPACKRSLYFQIVKALAAQRFEFLDGRGPQEACPPLEFGLPVRTRQAELWRQEEGYRAHKGPHPAIENPLTRTCRRSGLHFQIDQLPVVQSDPHVENNALVARRVL